MTATISARRMHVSTHLCLYLTTMGVAPSTTPTSSDLVETRYRSSTITSIVAAVAVVVTLFYLTGLYLVAHRWARDNTSLNKYSSVRLQRSAPCMISFFHLVAVAVSDSIQIVVYLLLVLTSIIEVSSPIETGSPQPLKRNQISISTWILVQYGYNHNYPSEAAKAGIAFILFVVLIPQVMVYQLIPSRFSGCWTTLIASTYLFLFLHPKLSRTPVASIGVQGIWICLTWILWIAVTAYLNAALPFVTVYSRCTLVYCGQLKALFGKSLRIACEE